MHIYHQDNAETIMDLSVLDDLLEYICNINHGFRPVIYFLQE